MSGSADDLQFYIIITGYYYSNRLHACNAVPGTIWLRKPDGYFIDIFFDVFFFHDH